jgi:hypothetical protein
MGLPGGVTVAELRSCRGGRGVDTLDGMDSGLGKSSIEGL